MPLLTDDGEEGVGEFLGGGCDGHVLCHMASVSLLVGGNDRGITL